ncbi:cysteine desulfurase family protein [Oscillospiraceae bacterium WX1]
MTDQRIYVDNAATTAVSDIAFNAMLPYFRDSFGNPSATHSYGTQAKSAVEESRKTIATCLGARVNEIYFTSGGTESDNWALMSSVALRQKGRHLITTEIEHSAVYKTAQYLEKKGYEVTFLPVDRYGLVSPEQLEEAIREDTILVSIMTANNEIGTIQPIRELCAVAKKHRVLFHTDAVQAAGHIPIYVGELGVDMLSISSHKFHGPKGIGALYINIRTVLPPMVIGGGQEKGKRSGTLNVSGIVGMAAALGDASSRMDEIVGKTTAMRDMLTTEILKMPGVQLTGHPENRVPGIASFIFSGISGEPLIAALNEAGICASAGSACSAGSGEPSRILKALGLTQMENAAPLRLSISEYNTPEQMNQIIAALPAALKRAAAERVVPKYINLDDY